VCLTNIAQVLIGEDYHYNNTRCPELSRKKC
jgi:hypothetical protein